MRHEPIEKKAARPWVRTMPRNTGRKIAGACLAVAVLLMAIGSLSFLVNREHPAHAQASPTATVRLSPGVPVEPGTAIAVTMTFQDLEYDSDTATIDYVFRADVKDAHGSPADVCEDNAGGYGLGVDRYMRQVDENPEVRTGNVSIECPAGNYTVEATISAEDHAVLATGAAGFIVLGPPEITVGAGRSSTSEGEGEITFTLTRSRDTGEALTVKVSITQEGDFLSGTPPGSVTFADGAVEAELSLTLDDDGLDEPGGSVTVTVATAPGREYAAGSPGSFTVTVNDDDEVAPPPSAVIKAPAAITAGETASVNAALHNLPAGEYTVRVTVASADDGNVAEATATLTVAERLPERDALGFIPIKPDTPTVEQEGSEAVVAWRAVAGGARSYTLLRSGASCGREGCRRQFTIDATQTSYRDTTLRPGVNYTYRVQGHYDGARTYFSDAARLTAAEAAAGVPGQPTDLTGRYRGSAGTMELSWTAPDPADDVRDYRLHRCAWATAGDITCGNFLTGSTAAGYTDSAIEAGQTYSYQVRAVGDHGDSYLAGYVRIKTPDAGAPPAPTGLTAVYDSAAGTVTLAWTAPDPSDGLTGYRVYRCRDWLPDGSHCTTILTGSTATTHVDPAVSGTRSYQVRALNAGGDSPYSNRVYLSID